jgi:hypothetical protein
MHQENSVDMVWSQIVARAWCDEGFMVHLRAEPRAILAEQGLQLPDGSSVRVVEGAEVKVVEDANAGYLFFLPVNPPGELTEEDLTGNAVAYSYGACGRCGGCGCRCR